MKNLIKTLKSTTLGDAIAPIKNRSMLDVVLDLVGIVGNLELAIALLAKLEGDRDTADCSLVSGLACLLTKSLVANFSEIMDDDVEEAEDADDHDNADDDDSIDISMEDFGEA